jgi:hypothetical protein
MSDPRAFERDPNLSDRYVGRTGTTNNSGWIIAVIIAVALLGLAAYSYRGTQVTSAANPPETTSGQGTRAPVPNTPPSTPVAPAQPRQ